LVEAKVICLNISKTGGTSLGHMLAEAFGPEEAVFHYGANATLDKFGHIERQYFLNYLAQQTEIVEKAKVFLGHTPYIEREALPFPARYVVMLREPVARLISGHSYGLNGKRLRQETFNFGLHLSASCRSSSPTRWAYENPVAQFFLQQSPVRRRDLPRLLDILSGVEIFGVTEDFEWSYQRVLRLLGRSRAAPTLHLNRTPPLDRSKLPASTLRILAQRNEVDIELYNHVCRQLNVEREAAGLSPLALTELVVEGPFSSGDYFPEMSSDAAFQARGDTCWLSSSVILNLNEEYIGYDFGPGRERPVAQIKVHPIGPADFTIELALEASDDGFVDDVRRVMTFELSADDECHQFETGAENLMARAWRVRRLSHHDGHPLAFAGLSFCETQPIFNKDPEIIRSRINHTLTRYNKSSYMAELESAA
jgi:hypothetical protein